MAESRLTPLVVLGNIPYSVMMRGIERTTLFRDDTARAECVARLAAVAPLLSPHGAVDRKARQVHT